MNAHHNQHQLHPRKLTCPLNRGCFNRKYIFQPVIFRGHVSFPGGSILHSKKLRQVGHGLSERQFFFFGKKSPLPEWNVLFSCVPFQKKHNYRSHLMVNWRFGLVVWIPVIPFWKGLLLRGTPGIPNHQSKPPTYIPLASISWKSEPQKRRAKPTILFGWGPSCHFIYFMDEFTTPMYFIESSDIHNPIAINPPATDFIHTLRTQKCLTVKLVELSLFGPCTMIFWLLQQKSWFQVLWSKKSPPSWWFPFESFRWDSEGRSSHRNPNKTEPKRRSTERKRQHRFTTSIP